MATPIFQFGTSRFLQAHVDLILSQGGNAAHRVDSVTVIQSSPTGARSDRVAAFNRLAFFPVRIRGCADGDVVDSYEDVTSVGRAYTAAESWVEIRQRFVEEAEYVISNTGDRGYELTDDDALDAEPPTSFPLKLLALLRARHGVGGAPLTIMPCELVENNGDTLRDIVVCVARQCSLPAAFVDWLETECRWLNSLVDRIVSEPFSPLGAVAEPYALWAVAAQDEQSLPTDHPALMRVSSLAAIERRKLFILNLGHTALVDYWRRHALDSTLCVAELLAIPAVASYLDAVYDEEVLPIFDALGDGEMAANYRGTTLERFANPFLDHRLRDIAENQDQKIARRIEPLLALADRHGLTGRQPRLRNIVSRRTS